MVWSDDLTKLDLTGTCRIYLCLPGKHGVMGKRNTAPASNLACLPYKQKLLFETPCLCDQLSHVPGKPGTNAGADNLIEAALHCPAMVAALMPAAQQVPAATAPIHPPIASMLRENCQEAAQAQARAQEAEWHAMQDRTPIPACYRPLC
jgi:hypothetical protein